MASDLRGYVLHPIGEPPAHDALPQDHQMHVLPRQVLEENDAARTEGLYSCTANDIDRRGFNFLKYNRSKRRRTPKVSARADCTSRVKSDPIDISGPSRGSARRGPFLSESWTYSHSLANESTMASVRGDNTRFKIITYKISKSKSSRLAP